MIESQKKQEAGHSAEHLKAYWKRNVRLLFILLSIWFLCSYGAAILFKDTLDAIKIAGFPLGFWFGQQGSLYIFVVLIFVYSYKMTKLDVEFDVHEN